MDWTLTETCGLYCEEPMHYDSYEDAFDALCKRVSDLTCCNENEIRKEVDSNLIWTADTQVGWAVVARKFAWLKGNSEYDWDIKKIG